MNRMHTRVDLLPSRDCPVCGEQKRTCLYEQRFQTMPEGSPCSGYDIVVCLHCGFSFADRIPDTSVFDHYYERLSRSESAYRGSDDSSFDRTRYVDIANYLSDRLPDRTQRILEIGCGRGGLLSQLKERGFHNVHGLDPSPGCAQVAKELYDIPVATGTIMINSLSSQRFDLVIMVGVLEHIPNVQDAMTGLTRLLSDDAHVFVDVPDATSFHLYPDAPYQEFSIEHINYFAPRSLTNLFVQHGLSEIETAQVPRLFSKTTVMPSVAGLFRKTTGTNPTFIRDDETEQALCRYIDQSAQEEQRVADKLDALVKSGECLSIWGAGTHTLHLLETTALGRCNIVAYIDSNPKLHGKQLQGRPIIAPSELEQHAEPILISSRVFQDDIVCQITEELKLPNELILLYSNLDPTN